jgi:hypothetical protein
VDEALAYLHQCQAVDAAIPDAAIVEYPTANLLKNWERSTRYIAIAM